MSAGQARGPGACSARGRSTAWRRRRDHDRSPRRHHRPAGGDDPDGHPPHHRVGRLGPGPPARGRRCSWPTRGSRSCPTRSRPPASHGSVLTNVPETPTAPPGGTRPFGHAGRDQLHRHRRLFAERRSTTSGSPTSARPASHPAPPIPVSSSCRSSSTGTTATVDHRHHRDQLSEARAPDRGIPRHQPGQRRRDGRQRQLGGHPPPGAAGHHHPDFRDPALRPTRTRCTRTRTAAFSPRFRSGPTTSRSQQPTAGTPSGFTGYSGAPPFVTTDRIDRRRTRQPERHRHRGDDRDPPASSTRASPPSISYGGASAVDGGVACPNTASIQCVTTGDGANGASVAWG